MSFRSRLTVFFVLIAIVPMVAAGLGFLRLLDASEEGKADARLAAGLQAAAAILRESRAAADDALARIASDEVLAGALQRGDQVAARRRARALLAERGARRLVLERRGRAFLDVGLPDATAHATRELVSSTGEPLGELQVSVVLAAEYVERVRRVVGLDAVVLERDDAVLAQTLRGTAAAGLPDRGTVTLAGDELRVVSFVAPGFRGARLRISLLARTAFGSPANAVVLEVFLVLFGFLVLAITLALAVSRSLQQQIATVLHGARRLGAGDLTTRVPAAGGDEFAALAGEFNRMASQLETRHAELHQERARVQDYVRRLGEALGANLDRDALLEIVVKTAVEGVAATAGRTIVVTPGGGLREHQRVGDPTGLQDSLADAEQRALRSGETQELVVGLVHAIAHPLRESDGDRRVVGVVLRRARRSRVHRRRARAVRLSRDAGGALAGERRAARDGGAGVGHRRAHPAVEPAALRGGAGRGGGARPSLRPSPGAGHGRHRRLQARQRLLRAPAGRRRAA